jgi:renalase
MRTAIIGAGIAGLACARQIADAGGHVTVFDKGRGPGGRMSTRRVETALGEARFDHGAQYFTARGARFRAMLEDQIAAGAAARWDGRFLSVDGAGALAPLPAEERFVGTPGMNALVRALAGALDVRWGSQVKALAREGAIWRLADEAGRDLGLFDALVCAIPAEQAAPLLAPAAPTHAAEAASARSAPCWAGLYVVGEDLALDFDGAKIAHGPLAWAARDRAKPGRSGPQTFVLHASPVWSAAHLEDEAGAVAAALWEAFAARFAISAQPVFAGAHRWRFAQVTQAAASPFAWDGALSLGVCGDWRIGPRVESAWTSGDSLGAAIAAGLAHSSR